ncbi:class I SAM-dependent methyltransferase [Haliea sp.]|uniref:class I SAM-dependent methyltransferase n=1 Tax=Haliea sp. TaxID=1932666 RepID=UPI0025C15674|nr:class I SAM-dependent methyltransferase [Haliea sp.]
MNQREQLQALLAHCEHPYALLDELYLPEDQARVLRTRNLRLIPGEKRRRGGKYAYAEWAHVIGIFQTLIGQHIGWREDLRVLDAGCGAGLLAIACEPFLGRGGCYTGLDVAAEQLAFCRQHYRGEHYRFLHLDTANPFYAPDQTAAGAPWPVADAGQQLVTALSVWTHFNERDARFYMAELERVLEPGGKALVTVFLLDEAYHATLPRTAGKAARFHGTPLERWVFDQPAYGSSEWLCPGWAQVPEAAIGMTPAGLASLLEASQLQLAAHYRGNWKEVPGPFFQDVLVLEKPRECRAPAG